MENHDAADGYNLLTHDVRLISTNIDPAPSNRAVGIDRLDTLPQKPSAELTTAADVTTTLSALAFPLLIPAAILANTAATQQRDAMAIRGNLEDKQLATKTLYPGSTQAGFLYFRLARKEDAATVQGMRFILQNVRSKETLSLSVRIQEN
jgi:hypothetical protein